MNIQINKAIFNNVRVSILNGDIEQAFETLNPIYEKLKDKVLSNQLILIESRFNRYKKEKTIGAHDAAELNRILNDFLNLTNELETYTLANPNIIDQPEVVDIHLLIKIFKEKTANKLHYSKDELTELHLILHKSIEAIRGNFDQNVAHLQSNRIAEAGALFDRIIFSGNKNNKLNRTDIELIYKIRASDEYDYGQRIIIVSALSLSLIYLDDIDLVRANILVDFMSDFEDKVWEYSLVGLFISIIQFDNKLTSNKYKKFRNRLNQFKSFPKVKSCIFIIYRLQKFGLFDFNESESVDDIVKKMPAHLVDDEIVNDLRTLEDGDGPNNLIESISRVAKANSFLTQPHNWFLPFYENNDVLRYTIDLSKHNVNLGELEDLLNKSILLPSFLKYIYCLDLENEPLEEVEKSIEILRRMQVFFEKHFFKISYLRDYFNIAINLNCTIVNYYYFNKIFEKSINSDFFKQQQLDLYNLEFTKSLTEPHDLLKIDGLKLLENGNLDTAAIKLQEYLNHLDRENPIDIEIHNILANYYYDNQKYTEAIPHLKALYAFETTKNHMHLLGSAYYLTHQLENSNSIYNKFNINELSPTKDEHILRIIGLVKWSLGDYEAQLSAWDRIEFEKTEENFIYIFIKAVANFRLKNYSIALENHTICYEIDPTHVENLVRLGVTNACIAFVLDENFEPYLDNAFYYYSEAYKLDPNDGYCLQEFGILLYRVGEYEHAEALLLSALKISNSNILVLEPLCQIYSTQNKKEELLEILTNWFELGIDPQKGITQYNMMLHFISFTDDAVLKEKILSKINDLEN